MTEPIDQFDKLPPSSPEAEMCLLGSMMLAGDDAGALSEYMQIVSRNAFNRADNQIIYDTLVNLHSQRKPIDAVLVREDLLRRNLYDAIGGTEYMADILNKVPSAAHGAYYAGIVADKAKRRDIIKAANDAIRAAYGSASPDEVARTLEVEAERIREVGTIDTIRKLGDVVKDVLEQKRTNQVTRLRFGMASLDSVTGGAPIAGMTFVAARPGMGKSQFVKQVLLNSAIAGCPVGLVSIEESEGKIGENALSNISGVKNSRIVTNALGRDMQTWDSLENAGVEISGLPYFVDAAQFRLRDIEASIRRMVKKHGCKIVAVDHLHLIDGGGGGENRTQEVTSISKALKQLFKELGIVGLVALQMNRGGNQSEDTPPELWNLRESGALEADGDLILLLHRRDYYLWKLPNFKPDDTLTVYVAKNKAGECKTVQLHFDGDRQQVLCREEMRSNPLAAPVDLKLVSSYFDER